MCKGVCVLYVCEQGGVNLRASRDQNEAVSAVLEEQAVDKSHSIMTCG